MGVHLKVKEKVHSWPDTATSEKQKINTTRFVGAGGRKLNDSWALLWVCSLVDRFRISGSSPGVFLFIRYNPPELFIGFIW